MKQFVSFLLVALTILPLGLHAQAPTAYKYSGYVNDFANAIDEAAEVKLQADLKQFDTNTGVQLAVVTVNTLNGNEPEVFAQELFRNWGIGHKQNNTGVLYLICPNEHKQRIHTGYGVESTLPDIICKRILRDTEPKMWQNISDAIVARANSIVKTVREHNDTDVTPETAAVGDQARNTYAENPDTSIPVAEDDAKDSVVGTVFLFIFAIGGVITFAIWFISKRKQEREEKEKEIKKIGYLLDTTTSKVEEVLTKSYQLHNHADASDQQKVAINQIIFDLNDFKNQLGSSSDLTSLNTSHTDLEKSSLLAYSFASKARSFSDQLESINSDISLISKARQLTFYCESLRQNTIHGENSTQIERDKIVRNYPESVWEDFDYKNYKQNIANLFARLDAIHDECETYQNNLNLANAKKVITLHSTYQSIKEKIEKITSTILNKAKQIEFAAGLISTSKMDEAYVVAKRNVEATYVSSKTVTRFNEAVKLCLAYRKLATTCKDPLQLASEYTNVTKEFGLISEKALFDVRKHHQDIEDAIRAEKRRKEQEEEDERRRQQALIAAAASYSSSSSYSSSDSYSSSSDSFSFGGGDSGGGGSNDSW